MCVCVYTHCGLTSELFSFLVMRTKMVHETMVYLMFNQLLQLLAWGRFSESCHHESFGLYTVTFALFSNMLKPFHGTVIKKYGECYCQVRYNGNTGIFNTWSSASNLSNSVWLVQCSQSVVSYSWEEYFKACCKSWITNNALTWNFVSNCKKVLKKHTKC